MLLRILTKVLGTSKQAKSLHLYNTKTRQKELFVPRKSPVRMYSCGPTVYSTPHIGNLRSVVFSDVLFRTLRHAGYEVDKVMNITDVGHIVADADSGEDKMEKAVREKGMGAQEIAHMYSDIFFDNLKQLNVDTTKTRFPRATEYIDSQIAFVHTLEEKGYTYTTSDGVYFDTSRFPTYGDFAHLDIAGLNAGERIDMGEKRNVTDFALWKLSPNQKGKNAQKRDQEWASPWGVGFPGWHIECSAMSRALLGKHFDIHTGGIDHIPVHHTNEIAQSECANGCPYVNYWLHNAFLTINKGEKMAKSAGAGETFTLAGLAQQNVDPLALRYYFLGAHYRTPMDFSWEALIAAQNGYKNLVKRVSNSKYQIENRELRTNQNKKNIIKKYAYTFDAAVNDDMNTAEALAALHTLLHSDEKPERVLATVAYMDEVLGLRLLDMPVSTSVQSLPLTYDVLSTETKTLYDKRAAARAKKDWAASDRLRDELAAAGYLVKDSPEGQVLTKG